MNNYESVNPAAAGVYGVPDDKKYVNEHVTIKCIILHLIYAVI